MKSSTALRSSLVAISARLMLAWHSAMAEDTLASTPVLSTAITETFTACVLGVALSHSTSTRRSLS